MNGKYIDSLMAQIKIRIQNSFGNFFNVLHVIYDIY
jgi:hypothetical protein